MRYIVPITILLVATAPLYFVLGPSRNSIEATTMERAVQQKIVYTVPEEGWLTIDLPARAESLRVLTTANIESGAVPPPTDDSIPPLKWNYSLDFEILDGSGGQLLANRHHLRSSVFYFRDDVSGDVLTSVFYETNDVLPATTKVVTFNFAQLKQSPAKLRLRRAESDVAVTNVVVRFFCQVIPPERRKQVAWERQHESDRQQVARASVYSHELLTERERINSLRTQQIPLAPGGVSGRDYEQRTLFTRKQKGSRPVVTPPPMGLIIGPNRHGIVPLPDEAGQVELSLTYLNAHNIDAASHCDVFWFGKTIHERSVDSLNLKRGQTSTEAKLRVGGGGLLEIRALHELGVQARFKPDGSNLNEQPIDITPERTIAKTYWIDQHYSVEFRVSHVGEERTPVRITLRNPSIKTTLAATWEMLTETGEILDRGSLSSEVKVSKYDRVDHVAFDSFVSDPAVFQFVVPFGVDRLRLTSTKPLLANAANRPPHLTRITRVPEDYVAYQRSNNSRTWFTIRPLNFHRLAKEDRIVSLEIQPRPPEDDPLIAEGSFEWEDFQLTGLALARHMLMPADPASPVRTTAGTALYTEFETNRDHECEFLLGPGQFSVRPRIVYSQPAGGRKNRSPSIELWIDGKLHEQFRLLSDRGELAISPIKTKPGQQHIVRIVSAETLQILMNYVDPAERPRMLKRTVHSLNGSLQRFEIEKRTHEEESFTLRCFRPADAETQFLLRVRIWAAQPRGIGPHQQWTVLNRLFDVAPATRTAAVRLLGSETTIGEPAKCFIKLGSDLPPGNYRIEVHSESDEKAYVLLTRISPGLLDHTEVWIEQQ